MILFRPGFGRLLVYALALVAVTAAGAHGATATWDRNPETDVAGYKLSYGTQPGVHTVTMDVGNVTSHTFSPPAGMRYYVVVQAYNAAGVLSEKSAEVTLDVPLPNRAPTLTQPANQTSIVNAQVILTLTGSDPDGTPVIFSAAGLPPGVSINASTGLISGMALAKGNYGVVVTVSDGSLKASRTFTWQVIDNVSAPIVVDLRPLDTMLYLGDDNYSGADWMFAYTWPANYVAAAILMKFNLSQIPSNATIASAALNVSLTGADPFTWAGNFTMSLHQVLGRNPDITRATGLRADAVTPWKANSCCIGDFPMAQADISAAQAFTTIDGTLGRKVFDATTAARAWLASPATNYGLLLNPDLSKGDGYRIFGSMEDPVEARRPFLRVTYTVPVTLPSNLTTSPQLSDPFRRVNGDFDGDGVADLSTYRAGEWRIWTSGSRFANMLLVNWGGVADLPVAADYDGDRITDIGIYQPLTGSWQIWLSKTQQPLVKQWGGVTNDQPYTVDADGDGKADLGINRNGVHWILLSGTNYTSSITAR